MKQTLCAMKSALTSAATVLAYYDPKFPEELSVSVFSNLLYEWLSFVLSNVTSIVSLWPFSFLSCS